MADETSRRVRTQVERDADGVAWRRTADTRPGYATWPQTPPGDPSWWRRTASPIPVTAGQMVSQSAWVGLPPPVDGETCAKWCGYCHLNNEPAPTEPHPDVTVVLAAQPDQGSPQPCRGCHACATDPVAPEPDIWVTTESVNALPPRRCWWHRLTRRAL